MNLQEVFKKIEMALSPSQEEVAMEEVKVEMATMKLAGGVVVEAEAFEAGENVFLVGEDDEKVAAPIGEHELEDGRILVIVEEGVIAEIRDAGVVEEVTEEVVVEEEMAEEAYVSKEEFAAAISEIKEMIAAMLPKEEEMSTEEKVEMSADEAPAAKKVAAAPVDKKQDMVQFAKKSGGTTLSRVMSKLS
tara:strand:+ start:21097 stop:21666 length:570 start_codon:yes stop_codon:yes gene_type:complete